MSKYRDTVQLTLPVSGAQHACRRAVSELGWRVLEDDRGRLVVKEVTPQSTSFTWSAKIELLVEEDGAGSAVSLNGSITGVGPIQKGHLRGQVGALKNKIEFAAADGAEGSQQPASTSMGEELERLGHLHSNGLLTDDEFAHAKARLLAGS
jgi:hypothetical protein